MAIKVKQDDRPFWRRRSILGENISNGNSIVAAILLASSGGAAYVGWLMASIPLGIAGLLSIVWNPSVAKATTIVGCWIVAGAISAWLLSMLCNSFFGMPAVGYFAGLVIGIAGVMKTID